MKQNFTRLQIILSGVVALALVLVTVGCHDPYADSLKKQGYTIMMHPRTGLGAGTIINTAASGTEMFVAAPKDCFEGIETKLIPNDVTLFDSKVAQNLSVDLGAKYLPSSPATIGAALGFTNLKKMDVHFGPTNADVLTVEGFASYLEGRQITKRCLNHLTNPNHKVIFSAARVKEMSFTFQGEKKINGNVDASALETALKANGAVNYSNVTDNSFKITSPTYIAYQAFKFTDLGLSVPEGADDASLMVTLEKGRFTLHAE